MQLMTQATVVCMGGHYFLHCLKRQVLKYSKNQLHISNAAIIQSMFAILTSTDNQDFGVAAGETVQ